MATSSSSSSTSSWREGMSSDNIKGLCLALSSSFFIGASFIVKKKGLKKAGASGIRAGSGGYSYLYEPLWWVGMITMIVGEIANFAAYAFAPAILVTPLVIVGEIANFAAYAFAPAILVTPLGALSIIISAALAHIILRERLHIFGILGCVLCVVGSTTIVLHAPQEREIESVSEVWDLAMEPVLGNYFYILSPFFFLGGGGGWGIFIIHVIIDWDRQSPTQVITEICGFVTILSGTFLLHKTKDMADGLQPSLSVRLPKHSEEDGFDGGEGIPLRRQEAMRSP
ncbi:Magnesium transporter NIPA2 [Glycine soja]|uniref:Probable magnesium transporter n=1 Tax=Glycine soja TaxID=3848 RepID=A0A0B2SK79_GLYSO|nr:Magnesium transporter NIPA2 [Glycine soja]